MATRSKRTLITVNLTKTTLTKGVAADYGRLVEKLAAFALYGISAL